tara:strand:+ start:301 stop:624 length:324 start_codon:yes stop_codon:yes gene_type:complete
VLFAKVIEVNKMRKITRDAIRAFRNREKFKRGNTEVYTRSGITYLTLFENTIALYAEGEGLLITSAGHATTTTKERLNGLPNVHIVQKNFEWFLNGELWNGSLIKVE